MFKSQSFRKKYLLKGSEKFKRVFLSPDRTIEERKERKTLVSRMKAMIQGSPGTHFIIRGNEVLEAPRE